MNPMYFIAKNNLAKWVQTQLFHYLCRPKNFWGKEIIFFNQNADERDLTANRYSNKKITCKKNNGYTNRTQCFIFRSIYGNQNYNRSFCNGYRTPNHCS